MFKPFTEAPEVLKKQKEELAKAQEEKRAQEEAERLKRLEMHELTTTTYELLREYLQKEELKRQLPNTKEEQITLDVGGYEFDNEGWKYNALLVSTFDENTELEIDYNGLRYTETLKKGVNQINLPNNVRIVSKKAIVVGLIRSNHIIKN
jgi:hypothetical protein